MNSFSPEEIISHLEIYGDNHDGNIIRALKSMKEKMDDADSELHAFQQADETEDLKYKISELEDDITELEEEIKELKEGKE